MRFAALALALAGCYGGATVEPGPAKPSKKPSLLERAHAYERGSGVARDYAAAAALYARGCNDGDGDPAACRALLRAMTEARGVAFDRARISQIATTSCLRSSDAVGCTLAALSARTDKDLSADLKTAIEKMSSDCDATHLDVCERGFDVLPDFGGSSARAERRRDFQETACSLGVIDGCVGLVHDLTDCGDEAGAKDCIAAQVEMWTKEHELLTDRQGLLADLGLARLPPALASKADAQLGSIR